MAGGRDIAQWVGSRCSGPRIISLPGGPDELFLEDPDCVSELSFLDREGWCECEDITIWSLSQEDDPPLQSGTCDLPSQCGRRLLRVGVLDQFDAQHQAEAPDIADIRISFSPTFELAGEFSPESCCPGHEVFGLEFIDLCERSCAGDRVPEEGARMDRLPC